MSQGTKECGYHRLFGPPGDDLERHGYTLARTKTKLGNQEFLFFLRSLMVPFQMNIISLNKIVKALHLMNSVFVVILMDVVINLPQAIFLSKEFVASTVPEELEEVTDIDGLSVFGKFFKQMRYDPVGESFFQGTTGASKLTTDCMADHQCAGARSHQTGELFATAHYALEAFERAGLADQIHRLHLIARCDTSGAIGIFGGEHRGGKGRCL